MNSRTFDRLTIAAARTSRRAALRLVGVGLLGGVFVARGRAAGAQRSDRDYDGLFDDDEVEVYGTNPDVYDTDGDGSGDGEEVYYGTDPLSAPGGGGVVSPGGGLNERPGATGCNAGLTLCSGFCVDVTNDFYNCGMCSNPCFGRAGGYCENNFCVYPCIAAGTC